MGKLLNSKFETYLMHQEFDLREEEEKNEEQMVKIQYEEYPEGFLQVYNENLMGYVESILTFNIAHCILCLYL